MASTYTWSIVAGSLPPGLSLSGSTSLTESLTGTPTSYGVFNFTVRVTNDISGAYDDQAYTLTIDTVLLEIAPKTSNNLAEVFDPSNPKLLSISVIDLTDVTGSPYSTRYVAARHPRIRADLGSGVKTYEIPDAYLSIFNKIGGKYVWRTSATPTTVTEVILV